MVYISIILAASYFKQSDITLHIYIYLFIYNVWAFGVLLNQECLMDSTN